MCFDNTDICPVVCFTFFCYLFIDCIIINIEFVIISDILFSGYNNSNMKTSNTIIIRFSPSCSFHRVSDIYFNVSTFRFFFIESMNLSVLFFFA